MSISKPVLMLSPCGTSLLTNLASRETKNRIWKYANEQRTDIPEGDVIEIESLVKKAADQLEAATIDEVAGLSAELNAIIKYYGGQLQNAASDVHYLVSSDTWLGNETAKLVKNWLLNHDATVQILPLKDLRTDNLESFQLALSEIVKWCDETIPEYQKSQYHVVFNLTGGFKSVQGFLQTLATFYADEAIYIFQSGSELLRLPKLPVKFVPDEIIETNLLIFRRMALNLPVTGISQLPDIVIMRIEDEAALSPWGELVWGRVRKELYGKKVYHPPSEKIAMTDTFIKSVKDLPADRVRLINQRMDDLAQFAEMGEKYNKKRLDFKGLKGDPVQGSTHEIDAWADRDAKRIFCHYDSETIVVDKLDKALH